MRGFGLALDGERLLFDAARAGQHLLAGFGKEKSARRALEKLCLELLLERGDAPAQGRLA
jgi:hypothetical protein